MRRLIKFCCLSRHDRDVFIRAGLLVVTIRLGLWLLPFHVVMRFLTKCTPKNSPEEQRINSLTIERVVWAIAVVSQYVPAATCLTQALATRVLLGRENQPSTLRIGVAKNAQGHLIAHAWVEIQGQVIIGNLPNLTDFTPLPALEMANL